MSETENLEETITNAGRLLEAGRVFSRASKRAFQLLGSVSNFQRTIEKTMPLGKDALEKEHIGTVLWLLADDPQIFKNPEEMRQGDKIQEMAGQMTVQAMESAGSLVSAASLVFAHAVFDATLFDFCRVTALWSWREWLEIIKDRKVSVSEIDQATKSRTYRRAVLGKRQQAHGSQYQNSRLLPQASRLLPQPTI